MIQQRIENPLATRILTGEFTDGDVVKVDFEHEQYVFGSETGRVDQEPELSERSG